MKRVFLFLATNLAVILVISVVTSLLGVNRFFTRQGLDYEKLLIFSAIVTPDATLFTMLLMAVPLMVLYEIGIIGAKIFGRSSGPAPDMNLPLDPDIPIGTAGHRVR